MKVLIVKVGEMKVAKGDAKLVTLGLGSCVGVAMFDPVRKVGGLLHYVIPSCFANHQRARENPFMFGDIGVRGLFESVIDLGANRDSLVVKAAGGSDVIRGVGAFNFGKRNALQLRRVLWELGLFLDGEDLGGRTTRNMVLDLSSGKVVVEYPGRKPLVL